MRPVELGLAIAIASSPEDGIMEQSVYWLRATGNSFIAFVPDLLLGIVVLLVGTLMATLLAAIARPLLHRLGFDRFLDRLGVTTGAQESKQGSRWASSVIFWVATLVTLMYSATVLRLDAVAVGIAAVIAYLPHVLGAALLFAGALALGNWVRARILASPPPPDEHSQRPLVAGAVRAGILAMGMLMALRELSIAPEIVTLAFGITLGSIALAAALAFGLGSRKVAGQMTRRWYARKLAREQARSQGLEP
jgi:hypothetical protein